MFSLNLSVCSQSNQATKWGIFWTDQLGSACRGGEQSVQVGVSWAV